MNPSESANSLKDLLGEDIQGRPLLIIVMSLLLAVMFFYMLRRRMAEPDFAGDDGAGTVVVREPPSPSGRAEPRDTVRAAASVAPVTLEDRPLGLIPQDSILRRHYLAHLKYMIETVAFPSPTDSVLRRHYDQLIAAELDCCIGDEGYLKRVIRRFEDQTRDA